MKDGRTHLSHQTEQPDLLRYVVRPPVAQEWVGSFHLRSG